jgi:hypothetical protein
MEKSSMIINISDLPEIARTELLDFYDFLKMKYETSSEKRFEAGRFPLSRFISSPIKISKREKYSRDDLHER